MITLRENSWDLDQDSKLARETNKDRDVMHRIDCNTQEHEFKNVRYGPRGISPPSCSWSTPLYPKMPAAALTGCTTQDLHRSCWSRGSLTSNENSSGCSLC